MARPGAGGGGGRRPPDVVRAAAPRGAPGRASATSASAPIPFWTVTEAADGQEAIAVTAAGRSG